MGPSLVSPAHQEARGRETLVGGEPSRAEMLSWLLPGNRAPARSQDGAETSRARPCAEQHPCTCVYSWHCPNGGGFTPYVCNFC